MVGGAGYDAGIAQPRLDGSGGLAEAGDSSTGTGPSRWVEVGTSDLGTPCPPVKTGTMPRRGMQAQEGLEDCCSLWAEPVVAPSDQPSQATHASSTGANLSDFHPLHPR